MTRRSVARDVRRLLSPRRGNCAPGALAWLLVVIVSAAAAQDVRVQPMEAGSGAVSAAESDAAQASNADSEDAPAAPDGAMSPSATPPDDARTAPRVIKPDAPTGTTDLTAALERRGDLTLRNSTIEGALFTISELWQINIVVGDVTGAVNGVFKNAPLREILDSILLSNGYSYRPVGDSLVVSPLADLGQINPFFKSATIVIHSADIDEVVEGARLLSTPQGQVRAMKSARSIFVLDFPDRVQMIREFASAIDIATSAGMAGGTARAGQPLEVAYFRTQHIAAKTAEDALQAVLSKDGRVTVLEREDRLVICDYAENLVMVEKVLQRIDRPRPQVRITALIYDISLQDIENLGISWGQFGYRSAAGSGAGVAIGTEPAQVDIADGVITSVLPSGANLAFGSLSRHFDIAAVAKALQKAKDTRLLADPSVAVLENEQAVFKSVQEIPIQQLTQTGQGGQIGTTTFREAGIKLTVIPKIAADGTIRMQVSPEFSRQSGIDPQGQPIIDTRFAETVLSAANRQTIVIAGLRQREDLGDFSGVPYLKDVRGVGKLFRSRSTTVRESELVVFISAEIIGTADPLNHREAMIVDTVDCRLNQIPEAEGCPPPYCPPIIGPVRLPPPGGGHGAIMSDGPAMLMDYEAVPIEVMPLETGAAGGLSSFVAEDLRLLPEEIPFGRHTHAFPVPSVRETGRGNEVMAAAPASMRRLPAVSLSNSPAVSLSNSSKLDQVQVHPAPKPAYDMFSAPPSP